MGEELAGDEPAQLSSVLHGSSHPPPNILGPAIKEEQLQVLHVSG